MKKLILLITLLGCALLAQSQTVVHHSYTTYYNSSKGEPDSVSWNLTPSMVNCKTTVRKNVFEPDPNIKECTKPSSYVNSGYDKGHLFSYEDAICNPIDRVECFYMSNMLPQLHSFNAGEWKKLEVQERQWAKTQTLHIIAGGIGSIGKLKSGVNIPAYFYKAIYMNTEWKVYIMPNSDKSQGVPLDKWLVTTQQLNKLTGLKL